ncbi:MAG: TPM domain-containing protein [Candidatus Omnitrophica bacterium]|nr:TPM domain-containing protein [Candidatus Omnitrophota bacterium]
MVNFNLTPDDKKKIVAAIREAESHTSGEIRVHVKSRCRGDVLAEAKKIFNQFQMHRTKHRNAVLIYVAPDSRQFAVLGDGGIHRRVGDDFWKGTRDQMSRFFSKGDFVGGIVEGVQSAGEKLKAHFPRGAANPDELPDAVTEG